MEAVARVERTIRDAILGRVDQQIVSEGRSPFFVQVGANDGATDDPIFPWVRDHGWSGIVVEPVPETFEALSVNYSEFANVKPVRCAVTDAEGEVAFFVPHNSRVASLDPAFVARKAGDEPPREIRVPARRLDSLIAEHAGSGLDVLVIDAEGHDLSVLSSGDFAKVRPLVVEFESRNLAGNSRRAAAALLESHGYLVLPMHADTIAVQPALLDEWTVSLLTSVQATYVQLIQQLKKNQRELAASRKP